MDKSVYPTAKRGGYFAFRTLISPTLIKVLYILGALAFLAMGVAIGIGYQGQGFSVPSLAELGLPNWAVGTIVAIIGNLIWRVFCEALILFFNIHEILAAQERLLQMAALEAKTGGPVGVK
jgi:hypothetical protein